MVDFILLKKTIDDSGFKREFIAEKIGISRHSLYKKLNGDTEFTASEMSKIKDILGLSLAVFRRIFFASKSELNSH